MGVHHRFLSSVARAPQAVALECDGANLTYGELDGLARRLAAAIGTGAGRTAIFGHRTAASTAGVLGALYAGTSYVPVHPGYPVDRAREMVARAGVRAAVVDDGAAAQAAEVLRGTATVVVIASDAALAVLRGAGLSVVDARDLAPAVSVADPGPDAEANLLFTSGSTGRPKGVRVTHGNLEAFFNAAMPRWDLRPTDRFSHLFELVFDLCGFDLFAAFTVGGTVVVPDRGQLLLPGRYAADKRLTVWFSVPSTANLALRQRALAPNALPDLRVVLFCGEALSVDIAQAFQLAAPQAVVENVYGPTEVTLACTGHRWLAGADPEACEGGVVPIGRPFEGVEVRVVDADGHEVAEGEAGELALAGAQVTPGYLDDAAQTDRVFVSLPGVSGRWYRTGDRVRRPVGEGPIAYLGRADSQVQVNGYRVEVAEVEGALRAVSETADATILPWPPGVGRCDALIGFVAGGEPHRIRTALATRLPYYMVPREIRIVDAMPLTTNGKVDRKALAALLEGKG